MPQFGNLPYRVVPFQCGIVGRRFRSLFILLQHCIPSRQKATHASVSNSGMGLRLLVVRLWHARCCLVEGPRLACAITYFEKRFASNRTPKLSSLSDPVSAN